LWGDVDSLTIMAIKVELDRLEVEYTSAKKDQLKVLLKVAYLTEHHNKATSFFRKYKGGHYDKKLLKPDKLIMHCTKFKAGENGIWTNHKAAKNIIKNTETLSGTKPIVYPSILIVYFKDGKVTTPMLPKPFLLCGCLSHLNNMDMGPQDFPPAYLMIGPSAQRLLTL